MAVVNINSVQQGKALALAPSGRAASTVRRNSELKPATEA